MEPCRTSCWCSIYHEHQYKINFVQIHAQQNFEIARELNPIQIKIEDDRVLNMLKIHENVTYKLTPLGILFPASIKNDKYQVFITCRKLNKVKKALINSKIYNFVVIIDLKKLITGKK